ncbi:hemagglutinin repeat-containing protein [Herbaspirillum sp. RTI4]|uniref:hemagglutinin repeat-containing protein n=1 Tax=Herbaspirillum sp. RTI4 TaxID=3048640 RepID=UPI002AB56F92|nr:hemagglutinin repeat-containing protein [Herbaspirillum sp. RTI4]MDY7579776.1 hemagglutinin repeat-containing protein [Herbaspirillum sp. RTI4]MEA9983579.1 hemagglutinin repeat-containing protein [Herbaspirillum sp. RTI4]
MMKNELPSIFRLPSNSTSASISISIGIGIGFGFGGAQNGWTLELGVAGGRGDQNGTDLSNTSTIVRAGNTANLISGGDTNLKGAVLAGNTVNAIVGGNLTIESLQDTSTYQSKDNSSGFAISVCIPPFCAGSSFSGSVASAKVNGNYTSVTTQSGIKAGDGGFAVVVKGDTDLKGGVIESNQAAIAAGNNTLITGTLTYLASQPNAASQGGAAIQFGMAGTAALVGFGASALEQLLRPDMGLTLVSGSVDIFTGYLGNKFPLLSPAFTEVGEAAKNTTPVTNLQNYLNKGTK